MAPSEATSNSSAAPHKPGSAGASSTTNKAEHETSAAGPIKIMTFNLRYGEAPDGVHGWENRRALVANVLKRYKPVLLGAQEALKYQIEYIMENALGPDYRWFGACRRGTGKDEHMAIFYDTRQLTLVENCDFWLSDTPGVVASQSWDSSLPRSTTYGRFRRNNATTSSSSNTNNDDEFYFFNTHLDHMGPEARIKGSRVIVEKLEEVMKKAKQNESPPPLIFLVGDFNSTRSEIPWNFLTGKQSYEGLKGSLIDCWEVAEKKVNQVAATRHDYLGSKKIDTKGSEHIDFIFYGPADGGENKENARSVKVLEIEVVTDGNDDAQFPSDHFPVVATVLF